MNLHAPLLPGRPRKNDALFMYGALQPKPFVLSYAQEYIEIVHGPSCRREQEVVLDRCEVDGVPVVERRNGGGTVVLGPGMVVTLVVGERFNASATRCFDTIHDGMIRLLDNIGIRGVQRSGISDLSIGNRKIVGSSLYMANDPPLYYYQSSLLVAHNPGLFERYLLHPPREPGYRCHRSHADFCTSLAAEGYAIDAAAIAAKFGHHLAGYLKRSS